ncbi:GIY-YIG nuclease family protein [Virgibacillus sp. MSP4-1]|uniref:GIY-YIG nuclease family protein n=1 Tax=Virgibacillus sp. MSP4-1 TaxID=2700081 RepID=UPI0005C46546|nr:GIY-YIG nuclease family protein [Virgibacillus sp. MSP4-1]QHS23767.1 GIY-YIG nuclease family protein [Virgibacillus sp. MSP4-1]
MLGKTIQIYLPFGSPRGIKIAEITNRTVQAILIPRNLLEKAGEREEVKSVGVYYLFGQDEDEAKTQLYVGEAENCYDRLKQHNREKDFWEVAIVFVTNNSQNQFTKTDAKFLESHSYDVADKISRYRLKQSIPASSFVPEWRKSDLFDIFETIKILTSTLGYPIFDELRDGHQKNNNDNLFYCKGRGIQAVAEYTEEGMVVLKNSEMARDTTESFKEYMTSSGMRRDTLIKDGIVKLTGDVYTFQEDYIFTSPSAAAKTVLGRAANGWTKWKTKDGKTLDQIKRKGK